MLENNELNDDMEGYDVLSPEEIALIQRLHHIQHPQYLLLLNDHGWVQNQDPILEFSDIANVNSGYLTSEDGSYVDENDNNSEDSDSVEFDLFMVDNQDLVLHDPSILVGAQLYPAPRPDPVLDPRALCDCNIFNNGNGHCLRNNLQNNWLDVDFQTELNDATMFYHQNLYRETNNLQRKRVYRDIWLKVGNHIELEHNQETGRYARIRLPNCSYALVRQIWPSLTGRYMGFRIG